MYTHVVFDVDGTLVDTEEAIILSLMKLLKEELGKSYSYQDLRFVLGIPGDYCLKELGIVDMKAANRKWLQYMRELLPSVELYPGICDILKQLKSKKIKVSVVTSNTGTELEQVFSKFGLHEWMDFIVCADDTLSHKPEPDPLLKLLELSGNDPSEVLYVGDTVYDSHCAKGANVDFGLVLWGRNPEKMVDSKYVFKNPKEILMFIGS